MALSTTTQRSKRAKQDDSIMGTNNSSIVSKRSVERLYHAEPHFYRYFVKKPQRRSPLINRGYWLRMHAVEHVVRKFLNESSEKRKVVINLGCGYDPLPFQSLAKNGARCNNAIFVDVDYPQLMTKKCEVISHTPQLLALLEKAELPSVPGTILLRSNHYLALGCDLRDLKSLEDALKIELDTPRCMFLMIAEVSATYMEVEAADALISCVAQFGDARFCLLEQYLPCGINHPFAQTMMRHFDKLQTPLRSIHRYPQLIDHRHRFINAGWHSVNARSLWDLWSDASFLTSNQRVALNKVEPFDEWEEFGLFASHYFLLVATKGPESTMLNHELYIGRNDLISTHKRIPVSVTSKCQSFTNRLKILHQQNSDRTAGRRYGAAYSVNDRYIGHHGGLGTQSRLSSADTYIQNDSDISIFHAPSSTMSPRMCHTITKFARSSCLLVGGRTSPVCALSDCWLLRNEKWNRVEDLPKPLYRHCSAGVALSNGVQGVVTYGGRTSDGAVSDDWFIWSESTGWRQIQCVGRGLLPCFGACLAPMTTEGGLVIGGMGEDGIVLPRVFKWSLHSTEHPDCVVVESMNNQLETHPVLAQTLCRFGAHLVWSSAGLLLVGGLSNKELLPREYDIIGLGPTNAYTKLEDLAALQVATLSYNPDTPYPLLVGHSITSIQNTIVIVGGGAVCFSFGAYWNEGSLTLRSDSGPLSSLWQLRNAQKASLVPVAKVSANESKGAVPFRDRTDSVMTVAQAAELQSKTEVHTVAEDPASRNQSQIISLYAQIPRIKLDAQNLFARIVGQSMPAILEDLELGHCTKLWTLDYLKTTVGARRSVVVHEALNQNMSFRERNFSYITKPFGKFLDEIRSGGKQYLRSLALDKPADRPASFAIDYPEIGYDFQLPAELVMVDQNAHSSVLRISGPVAMWLHYDVMANVLCQIHGTKKLLLYPPTDILRLEVPPGESSSAINVFDAPLPAMIGTHPHEAILQPGDVLYIPPLWLHTACPIEGVSIAINVFFRNLKSGYAAGRDVYGNRDLQAYEKGRHDIQKIKKSFAGLPPSMGQFYMERLAEELREQAHMHETA